MVFDLVREISGVVAILIALDSVVSAEWSVGELAKGSWELNVDSCCGTLRNDSSSRD